MYDVLSIKYRPKNFDDLVGQEPISNTLSLALRKDKLTHAYLFSGLRGSGKTSTARILSKAILCDEGPTPTPCGVCSNCVMANENRHIDIIELDGASNRNIDDIRDIIEQSKYKPSVGKYKIFIIDEVHMLTKQAFNALLKTLEEPPAYVKFILATTDANKVPATILSRAQHFRFRSISQKDITNHIASILGKENIKYEDSALQILARNGGGSLRDTLTLLDQAIVYSNSDITITSVADMLGAIDKAFLDKIFENIFSKNIDGIKNIVKDLESYEADSVIDEVVVYVKEKLFLDDNNFSTIIVDRFFRILSDSKYLLTLNSDNSFVLMLMFFKMIEALRVKDINDLINELESSQTNDTNEQINENKRVDNNHTTDNIIVPNGETKYNIIIDNIYKQSTQVGECFKKNFKFESFKDDNLIILNLASGECIDILRHAYSKIKIKIQEIFGVDVKITFIKKQQPISVSQDIKTNEVQERKNNQEVSDNKDNQESTSTTKYEEHIDNKIDNNQKVESTTQNNQEVVTEEIDNQKDANTTQDIKTPFDTPLDNNNENKDMEDDLENNSIVKKAAQILESKKIHITTIVNEK